MMNINVQKDRLIGWITQIKDTKVIEKLFEIQRTNQKDAWDDLSEHEKNKIGLGLKDFEEVILLSIHAPENYMQGTFEIIWSKRAFDISVNEPTLE